MKRLVLIACAMTLACAAFGGGELPARTTARPVDVSPLGAVSTFARIRDGVVKYVRNRVCDASDVAVEGVDFVAGFVGFNPQNDDCAK